MMWRWTIRMFQEFAERQAIVSTTPLGLAHGLSAYLKEYPHGCTEQITSRAFPWLVLKDDANFGIDQAEAAKAIADTMNQLARRQGRNGGFGYWSTNEQEGFDYLTVYVGHFLTECKSSGLPVPARLYQSTLRRLRLHGGCQGDGPDHAQRADLLLANPLGGGDAGVGHLPPDEERGSDHQLCAEAAGLPRGQGAQGDVAPRFHGRLAGRHLAAAEKGIRRQAADPGAPRGTEEHRCPRIGNMVTITTPAG